MTTPVTTAAGNGRIEKSEDPYDPRRRICLLCATVCGGDGETAIITRAVIGYLRRIATELECARHAHAKRDIAVILRSQADVLEADARGTEAEHAATRAKELPR